MTSAIKPTNSQSGDYSLEAIAQLAKSSGDPLRLEILRALRQDSFGVLELSDIFVTRQSGMSHHLKVLAKAGAVNSRREGNAIFYQRALPDLEQPQGELLQALFNSIDRIPLNKDTLKRINAIKQQRMAAARAFFNKHAEDLRSQQERIAIFDQYAPLSRDMLLQTPTKKTDTLMEIGPGAGEFLSWMSDHFSEIIGLDISEELLQQSRDYCHEAGLNNISFLLGDTQTAIAANIEVSHIVCNMVLHHLPSPADVFVDSARLLKPEGSLIVTDLCRHQQSWAKERCGDLWLGFEPEQLSNWAKAAGLQEAEAQYLGLRNGFQIQTRQFNKSFY